MKTRRICAVKLLDAPLEICHLLFPNCAQNNILPLGFGNGGVWSRMAAKSSFFSYSFAFIVSRHAGTHATTWSPHGLRKEQGTNSRGAMQLLCGLLWAAQPTWLGHAATIQLDGGCMAPSRGHVASMWVHGGHIALLESHSSHSDVWVRYIFDIRCSGQKSSNVIKMTTETL